MTRPTYNWKLPAAIEARLGNVSYGAQRSIHEEGYLLVVLHQPPGDSLVEREHAVFLRRPDGAWLYQGNEQGAQALVGVVEAYRKQLLDLEQRLDRADEAEELFPVLDRAIPLARAAGNMREALQTAREAARNDKLLIDARDRAADVARGCELLLANARVAFDYRIACNAEQQVAAAQDSQEAQHKLNLLAAWTLPLMTVAAIFGMNLPSGLEGSPVFYFWIVFAAGLLLGSFVRSWVAPQRRNAKAPTGKGGGTGQRATAGLKKR